jgi:hypothetical protein
MLYKVYNPEGKMFEVSADKAKELMALGWIPWHPKNPPKLASAPPPEASED